MKLGFRPALPDDFTCESLVGAVFENRGLRLERKPNGRNHALQARAERVSIACITLLGYPIGRFLRKA
jgi:hypothetical protein